MAATSYSGLQSLPYSSLGSQGDLYHSANYGTYDSGVGLLTSHPYQYQTTSFGNDYLTNPQNSSYSNDYLHSNYSTQLPSQQPKFDQDSSLNNYSLSHMVRQNEQQPAQTNRNDNYTTPTTNTTQSQRKTNVDNHPVESNNHHQQPYGGTTQPHPPAPTNNQHQQQPQSTTQHHPPAPTNNQRQQQQVTPQSNQNPSKQQPQRQQPQPTSQFNTGRSDHKNNNPTPKQRAQSNDRHDPSSETPPKTFNPPRETKPTKSSQMRAAAIKQKEESREQKRRDGNFPSLNKKPTPPKDQQPLTDDEQNDEEKNRRSKKGSHSVPKQRKSRHDKNQTEDNYSSADDDRQEEHHRSKSKKRHQQPDSQREKYPPMLPPVRPGRGPPYYDPAYDYPPPFPYPPYRGRYPPYYDDYGFYRPYPNPYDPRHRRMYEDGYEGPPYIGSYNDPYDGFFDYEKRKSKSKTKHRKDKKEVTTDNEDRGAVTGNETEYEDDAKSQYSKKSKNTKNKVKDDENISENHHRPRYNEPPPPPFYDGRDMLEAWRQDRNDYLKSKFKPTVHDVLYSQQWMKSDSYLENQRRRALRDTQGYYFPYKKYTLKDYKDLQKMEAQNNPYASVNEPTLDRKDRARKRHDYGTQIERQGGEQSGAQTKTPRDASQKKPWHISNGEPHDPEKLSKRERALEYAKVQVVKNRSNNNQMRNRSNEIDPTEQYVNGLFPETNNDGNEGSVNENNQSVYDDEDQ